MSKKAIILTLLVVVFLIGSTFIFKNSSLANDVKRIRSCRFGGRNRGLCNNNPGNIRKTSYNLIGLVSSTDPGFSQFDTIENGILGVATLLYKNYLKKGFNTIEDIINRYAPPVENNTNSYISFVVSELNSYKKYVTFEEVTKDTVIVYDTELFYLLVKAIIKKETSYIVTDSQLSYISNQSIN